VGASQPVGSLNITRRNSRRHGGVAATRDGEEKQPTHPTQRLELTKGAVKLVVMMPTQGCLILIVTKNKQVLMPCNWA
jgi:hypothetical protein